MKQSKQQAKEKAQQYGFCAMSNDELLKIANYKGSESDFYISYEFKAMKELVRRQETAELKKVTSSMDAYKQLSFLDNVEHEEFWVIYLNRSNKITATEFVSKGGITGTVVDVKLILKRAIELKANGLILAHNHPSGSLNPSDADKQITQKLSSAANLIDCKIFDHLIISNGKYFSFSDEGII